MMDQPESTVPDAENRSDGISITIHTNESASSTSMNSDRYEYTFGYREVEVVGGEKRPYDYAAVESFRSFEAAKQARDQKLQWGWVREEMWDPFVSGIRVVTDASTSRTVGHTEFYRGRTGDGSR